MIYYKYCFPGQSPRPWQDDFEGMQELHNTCLLGAYAVCREFQDGVYPYRDYGDGPPALFVVWADPVETSNANVAGMLNTLPGRMLHAGVTSL